MGSLDLRQLRVRPLQERRTLVRVSDILIRPESNPKAISDKLMATVSLAAERILSARNRSAQVILAYGAHLLRNGSTLILAEMMERGWVTHLATNGAGTIHDWEFAWLGGSTEGVEENVVAGTFGTWDETGRVTMLALATGALQGLGYGGSLGKFIATDGTDFPSIESLETMIGQFLGDPMLAAVCEVLTMMRRFDLAPGRHTWIHAWKEASLLAQAWQRGIPVTVHPGIGYDIVTCHPMFDGAVIGRAGAEDFRGFASAVNELDGGVLMSIGSAVMAPQVFEKSLSCVHNLRFQRGLPPVSGHSFFIVDLQNGGQWDWQKGEPPKNHPAYYLRFCKSFSRMGGEMHYAQIDNVTFIHHLYHELCRRTSMSTKTRGDQ